MIYKILPSTFINSFVIIIMLIVMIGCEKLKVDDENVSLLESQSYFPEKLFPKLQSKHENVGTPDYKVNVFLVENEYDTIVSNCFSKELYTFKEPVLFNFKSDKEIYRFTQLNSFSSNIMVRIELDKNKTKIFWKELSKSKDLRSDKIVSDKVKKIEKKEFNEFLNKLNKIKFWNIYPNNSYNSGHDGSNWLLEGLKNGKYYAIQFREPKNEDFKNVCEYMISQTDLKK